MTTGRQRVPIDRSESCLREAANHWSLVFRFPLKRGPTAPFFRNYSELWSRCLFFVLRCANLEQTALQSGSVPESQCDNFTRVC